MNISKIHINHNAVISAPKQNSLKEKIYKVSRDALVYLVNNRYSVVLSCWSYLFIEWVATASVPTSDSDYVYNLETCRKKLCEYSNNYTAISGSYLTNYDVTCNMTLEEMPYYSFADCIDDLCRYTSRIGEKFYACTGETIVESVPKYSYLNISEPAFQYWHQICPKRHFAHLSKIKQLKYLTRCIEKMCKLNDTISTFGREILQLCKNSPLEKLDEVLHEIFQSINRLKNNLNDNDSLSTTTIITSIVASVTGILSAIATIVGVVIVHRTEPSARSIVPTEPLAESIANVAYSGIQATSSMLSESVNQFEHLLPTTISNSLQEIRNYARQSITTIEEIIEIIETTV